MLTKIEQRRHQESNRHSALMPYKNEKVESVMEPQELYCHACGRYIQFRIDKSLDGNHTLNCPNCGHEHYRVVKNGIITDERWQSSGPVWNILGATSTATSVDTGTISGGYTLRNLSSYSYYSTSATYYTSASTYS